MKNESQRHCRFSSSIDSGRQTSGIRSRSQTFSHSALVNRGYASVKALPDDARRWKFEIEWNGRHIGWVSSYPIDENYEWLGEIKDGQTVHRAIGIDICERDMWGHGIGTNALRAFMNYYFENGMDELYTQTWSGNVRMIRCAEKLGFVECNRGIGTREVDRQKYDGLTFRLERT